MSYYWGVVCRTTMLGCYTESEGTIPMKFSVVSAVVCTALLALASGCSPVASIDEARTAFFATVEGSDQDCTEWLDWCLEEGYPEAACAERNEYCVGGQWVGGDRDGEEDPCRAEADRAYRWCLGEGGTEESCREAAAEAYEECAAND